MRLWRDPFILAALAGFGGGLALNLSGLPRPAFFNALNTIIIPLGSLLLLASIGMALHFGCITRYWREAGAVAAIKFILLPAVALGLGSLAGLGRVDGGLPLRVAVILAAMPVGFTALVPPTLYDLDVDLANACWFLTTALILPILPLLFWVAGMV